MTVRQFETGATRDGDTDKLDFEGFLHPEVLERFAQYMHQNRYMADGSMRDSDNWQKGIPISSYVKSLWRHFHAVWRAYRCGDEISEDELCGVLFNAQGLLLEVMRKRRNNFVEDPELCDHTADYYSKAPWGAGKRRSERPLPGICGETP